ncbi:hypothetical protein ACSSS7_005774 [Eimeria intestinalis]
MGKPDLHLSSLTGFPTLGEATTPPLCPAPAGAWGLRAAAAKLASARLEAQEAGGPSESAAPAKGKEDGGGGSPEPAALPKAAEELGGGESSEAPAQQADSSSSESARAEVSVHRTSSPRSPKTISTCAEAPSHEAQEEETDEEKQQASEGKFDNDGSSTGGVPSGGRGPSSVHAADELGDQWGVGEGGNWGNVDDTKGHEASLRHFLAPLSREQLLDLLSWAALRDRQVYEQCAERVHASPSSRRLMVRNVHYSTSDERFTSFFETFGCVDDALIVRERDGQSRGYGFVTFTYPEGVNRCFVACPLTLDGRQLHVKLAADLFTSREQTKLFVRNLHESTTAQTLRQIFSAFGTLEECVVVRDGEGRSRGYGFLNFSTPMEAFKAVQMSERIIDGRMVFIHFASSSTKGTPRMERAFPMFRPLPAHAILKSGRRSGGGGGGGGTGGGAGAPDTSLRGAPESSTRGGGSTGNAWDCGSLPSETRGGRSRRAAGESQRGSYSNRGGGGIGGRMGGPPHPSAADPLLYSNGGAFTDMYGFSLSPFPFFPPSQGSDMKGPLSPAYTQYYPYPLGPYYPPLAPEAQSPPFGPQSTP